MSGRRLFTESDQHNILKCQTDEFICPQSNSTSDLSQSCLTLGKCFLQILRILCRRQFQQSADKAQLQMLMKRRINLQPNYFQTYSWSTCVTRMTVRFSAQFVIQSQNRLTGEEKGTIRLRNSMLLLCGIWVRLLARRR